MTIAVSGKGFASDSALNGQTSAGTLSTGQIVGQFDSLLASMLGGGLFGLAPVQQATPVAAKPSTSAGIAAANPSTAGHSTAPVSGLTTAKHLTKSVGVQARFGPSELSGDQNSGGKKTDEMNLILSNELHAGKGLNGKQVAKQGVQVTEKEKIAQMPVTDSTLLTSVHSFGQASKAMTDAVNLPTTAIKPDKSQSSAPAPKRITAIANIPITTALKPDKSQSSKPEETTGMENVVAAVVAQTNLQVNQPLNVHLTTTHPSPSDDLQLDVRDPQALSQFGKLISVKASVSSSQSQLQVQVVPQGMGQLNVTVTNAPGGVQVHVTANEASTFVWLNQQIPQLQASMQAAGLNISGFQLSYEKNGSGQNSESRQDKPSSSRRIVASTSSTTKVGGLAASGERLNHLGDISVSV